MLIGRGRRHSDSGDRSIVDRSGSARPRRTLVAFPPARPPLSLCFVQRPARTARPASPPSGMRKRDANESLAQTRGSEFISRGEHGKARGEHEIRSASMQKTRGLIRR